MIFLLFFLSTAIFCHAHQGQGYGEHFVPGEILVKSDSSAIVRSQFSQMSRSIERTPFGYYKVKLKPGKNPKHILANFKKTKGVQAQPNYIYRASKSIGHNLGNRFSEQWSFVNDGKTPGAQVDSDMDIEEAWQLIAGQREKTFTVPVAIIDSGIDLGSSQFLGQVDALRSFSFVKGNADVGDLNGHGSHVAGVVAARHSVHGGVRGINQNVDLIVVQALNRYGMGTTEHIIQAVKHAVDQGAKVINASYGGGFFDQAAFEAYQYAAERGVIVVAAAGNAGEDNDKKDTYPANYDLPNIISVGSTTIDDSASKFSNYGLKMVDVFAPGEDILSAAVERTFGAEKKVFSLRVDDIEEDQLEKKKPYKSDIENNNWQKANCENSSSCLEFSPLKDFKPTEEFTNFEILLKREFPVDKTKHYILRSLYKGAFSWTSSSSNYSSAAVNAGESDFWMLPAGIILQSTDFWKWQETDLTEPGFFYSGTSMWDKLMLSFGFSFSVRDQNVATDFSQDYYRLKEFELIEKTPQANSILQPMSGTSMAAPHVTGVVSALIGLKPNISVDEIREILLKSCDQTAELKGKSVCGGRLNMRRAIEHLVN